MKKAKRVLAVGLSAALCLGAVGAIAGCGGSGGSGEIKFWYSTSISDNKIIRELVDAYNNGQGKEDGVIVKPDNRQQVDRSSLFVNAPNVLMFGDKEFKGYAVEGLYQDMTGYYNDMAGSYSEDGIPQTLTERFRFDTADNADGKRMAGKGAYRLLRKLLCEKTHDNLWDVHPPFQIDGNFGATAGIAEMLLQSGAGKISLFPAIPDAWKNVSFRNLRARGNFTVSAARGGGKIEFCRIQSLSGGRITVSAEGMKGVTVTEKKGRRSVKYSYRDNAITFDTERGGVYEISGFRPCPKSGAVKNLSAAWRKGGVLLKWRGAGKPCAVYRATGNDRDYRLLTVTDGTSYTDGEFSLGNKARLTYKVVAADGEYSQKSKGAVVFLHPADELEKERYERRLHVNNIYANDWDLR